MAIVNKRVATETRISQEPNSNTAHVPHLVVLVVSNLGLLVLAAPRSLDVDDLILGKLTVSHGVESNSARPAIGQDLTKTTKHYEYMCLGGTAPSLFELPVGGCTQTASFPSPKPCRKCCNCWAPE